MEALEQLNVNQNTKVAISFYEKQLLLKWRQPPK
jgi:hypothetical protein